MLYDAAKPRIPINNFLLSQLSPEDFHFIRPHLDLVTLPLGKIFADYCDPVRHCFFPNNGMISLLSVTEEGATCEVGYVGYEGVVGMSVIFGRNELPYQALVQAESEGFRVPIEVVAELFGRSNEFHDASLRFTYVILRQFAQTSACNRFHSVQARLCRWFSVMCERSGNRHLALTQEFLAYMLGVQRTSVSAIAKTLQQDGVIKYSRGKIEVLNLEKLKAAACECLKLINEELENFIGENKSPYKSATRQTRASR
ncbi:MAG: Crp/Fnr family transcriptional regulator [Pyrinomonadaceae bacterium]